MTMFKKLIIGLACSTPLFVYASPYSDLIHKHSVANGLDPNLVTAIMARESAFKANARSHKDARGLMQVIPSTARLMGVDPSRLYEPEQSIIAGTRYLAFLNKRFNGDLTKMIAGYNAGHGAVEKFGGIPPYRETQNYVRLVSSKYQTLNGGGSFKTYTADNHPTEASRKSDILVLASWQQNQYPQYSANQIPNTENNSYSAQSEPVRLRVNNQPSNEQNVQQASFVQTLNKGQYVQVF